MDGKLGLATSVVLVALLPAASQAQTPSVKDRLAEVRAQVAQREQGDEALRPAVPKLEAGFANAPQP